MVDLPSEGRTCSKDLCERRSGFTARSKPLLARDDKSSEATCERQSKKVLTHIEVGGKVKLTNVRFRDDIPPEYVCQRIVCRSARRVR